MPKNGTNSSLFSVYREMVQKIFTISNIFLSHLVAARMAKMGPLNRIFHGIFSFPAFPPLLSQGHLSRKYNHFEKNFYSFLKAAFLSLPQGQKVLKVHGFIKKFPKKSFYYTKDKVNEKSVVSGKIFPRKQKKTVTTDKRADDLSPVLCLTVTVNPVISPYFSTHLRRNLLRPATSAHLIPTVSNCYFSVI